MAAATKQQVMKARTLVEVELVAEGFGFPEGPVVLPDGTVLVLDILTGHVIRVATDGTTSVAADVGGGPNGAAIGPDGALYVCNNGGFTTGTRSEPCIQRVDLATGTSTVLYGESAGHTLVAPNDLVFDGTGNFWFTDLRGHAIYYASPDGTSLETAVTGISRPNGIGLSPDGSILYWAQTDTRQVLRRRVESPGVLAPSIGVGPAAMIRHGAVDWWSLLVGLPGCQELDSLAVDSSGAVCVGTLLEGGITEVPADGGLDNTTRWELPPALQDGLVTNIAFGGPDLTTAYLTCSQHGRLVRCRWHRSGLRLAF